MKTMLLRVGLLPSTTANDKFFFVSRSIYLFLAFATMCLGLLSRSSIGFPEFITLYVGDMLWALLIFWLVSFLAPNRRNTTAAIAALIFSYSIEFSQLYQANWINEIRHTALGSLVLGFGFRWSDLLAYSGGISLGFALRYCFQDKLAGRTV